MSFECFVDSTFFFPLTAIYQKFLPVIANEAADITGKSLSIASSLAEGLHLCNFLPYESL